MLEDEEQSTLHVYKLYYKVTESYRVQEDVCQTTYSVHMSLSTGRHPLSYLSEYITSYIDLRRVLATPIARESGDDSM